MKYKVVERFRSVQGEGYWTGTQMDFVRLSQCPVGGVNGLCQMWDGTHFICDTGNAYKKIRDRKRETTEWHPYTEVNEVLSAEDIVKGMETDHLCLTGGEPLVYDIGPIVEKLHPSKKLHIETSGTVDGCPWWSPWITLSPKAGCTGNMLAIANELKLLVHHDTTEDQIKDWIKKFNPESRHFYLQPIEDLNPVQWKLNIARAMELLKVNKHIRLSIQVHKAIEVR